MSAARKVPRGARTIARRRRSILGAAVTVVSLSVLSGPPTTPTRLTDTPTRRHLYRNDFNAPLDWRWTVYTGRPGGDPAGWWRKDRVTVSGGMLVLTGKWDGAHHASGGAKLEHGVPPLTYGKVLIRYRAEPGPYALAFLLWPADKKWPPEIDFVEDNAGDRQLLTTTQHYRDSSGRHIQVRDRLAVDSSTWHTAGVEWQPGSISYLMDGRVWARRQNVYVPSGGMHLALQQQAWPCNYGWYQICPTPSSPANRVFIDWIDVWGQ